MKNLRILIAINTRWWNAEAHYAFHIALGLRDAGHQVFVLGNPGSPVIKKAQAAGFACLEQILLDSRSPWQHLKNWWALKAFLQDQHIDLINSFKSNGSFLFSLAYRKFGIPHIKTRGDAKPPSLQRGNRALFGTWGAAGVICASRLVQTWVEKIQLPGQNITHIYFGMPPLPPRSQTRKNPLGLPEGPVLCLLGRSQGVKGHITLLEAFRELNHPTAQLLFLVKSWEEHPEIIANIRERCQSYGITPKVHLVGFVENLSDVLDGVDIGVIPSLNSEVICRVAVEFMSKSIPLVAFPTGTLPEVVGESGAGVITRDKSVSALAQALRQMLENPSDYGVKGYQAFLERFQLTVVTQQTLNFYQKCQNSSN